MSRHQNVSPQY